ncbi:hypothetical protein AB0C87_25980 [Actinomadura sp. NPDC048021]|uniref:hypothetical protein n=1 Tax=Actinomadura sp. NPDC048021 TaxID=3155385 RepID=UPI0033E877E3
MKVRKLLRGAGVAALFLAVLVAARCSSQSSSQSSSETPNNEWPPSATAPIEPTTPVASTTATAEPSTSQPEATTSDVSLRPGKVVGAFADGPQGPFLVLALPDEDQGDLEIASKDSDALRKLDVTGQSISMLWKVNVPADVLPACRPNLTRMVFKEYPSCTGSADATPSTTNR